MTATLEKQKHISEPQPPKARKRLPGTDISFHLLWILTIVVVMLLIAYPVIRILWLSVSDPATGVFNSEVFQRELTDSTMWEAALNTVVMAAAATTFAVVVAVPMAWLCERSNMRGRKVISSLVFLTFMNPPLLLGIGYIMIFGPNIGLLTDALHAVGIQSTIFSWWGLIFVTACGSYAIIFMMTSASLAGLDGDLENAARAHGASTRQILTKVSLPLVKPAIASGCLLSFVMSLNAFGVQALIATPARIPLLTTTIYSYFSYPVQFTAAASQAVVLIGMSVLVTVLANLYIAAKTFPTIAGKGAKADLTNLTRSGRTFGLAFCSLAVAVSVVIPMTIVVITSFLKIQGRGIGLANLGFDNYRDLFELGDVVPSITNSLKLGLISAVCMVLIALALTYYRRQRARGSKFVFVVAEIPYVIPGIVLAIGCIAAFSRPPLALYGTAAILVIAYVAKFLPVAARFTENALGQVGVELEEAVYAHGGSKGRAFRRVLMPLMKRGLVTAGILSFIFAFNELSASILLIGTGTQVSSTVLLHYSEEGLFGPMNAYAAILFLVTAICYGMFTRLAGRSMTTASF